MGLDIYFYKVKRSLVEEDLVNTYNKFLDVINNKAKKNIDVHIKKINSLPTQEEKTAEAVKLEKYLNKEFEFEFHWLDLTTAIKNGDEITPELLEKVHKIIFDTLMSPANYFYARKEWWIPERVWGNLDAEDDGAVYNIVRRSDLDYFISVYEKVLKEKDLSLIGLNCCEWNDREKSWVKSQLKDLNKLRKSLKDDEVVLGIFSY